MRDGQREMRDLLDRLGVDRSAEVEPAAGGASGSAWFVRVGSDRHVLRVDGSASRTDARLAAMDAAGEAGLPVPRLVRRSDEPGRIGLLLTYLEGVPIIDLLFGTNDAAAKWGIRIGALHRRLHAITAPQAVLSVADPIARPFHLGDGRDELPEGDSLLHFDWHPGNLLADEGSGEITGIVDWDNARRGHPSLDLARTESMLTVEPFIATLDPAGRRMVERFREAWAGGYGPDASAIAPAVRRWAGRVMLADLAHRYAAHPERLDPARRWADGATQ